MWKDYIFIFVLLFLGYLSYRVFLIPIQSFLKKTKIENFQSQSIFDSSSRTLDSQEYQFADYYAKHFSERKPDIIFNRIHMLAPNIAQYGKSAPVYVHSTGSIPHAALPILDLRDPWSTDDIIAAEIPESEHCHRSASGLFNTCGVKAYNS